MNFVANSDRFTEKSTPLKAAVGKIVKIQDFANKFEHRQLLSPSPLSAAAQTVS